VADLEIVTVPQRSDNYAYVLHCREEGVACVIDCSEPPAVLEAVRELDARLVALWATHHHYDHVGGHEELLALVPNLEVLGSTYDHDNGRIPGQTRGVAHGEAVTIGAHRGCGLHIPGHTLGHIAYYFEDMGVVFTGDTLFGAGCGRLFEGTPAMMSRALREVLGGLPGETRVFCGHEYTESNLRFALHVDGDNPAVVDRADKVRAARQRGEPTVPFTIAAEWETNPFMRGHEQALQDIAATHGVDDVDDPSAVLGALRSLKDRF